MTCHFIHLNLKVFSIFLLWMAAAAAATLVPTPGSRIMGTFFFPYRNVQLPASGYLTAYANLHGPHGARTLAHPLHHTGGTDLGSPLHGDRPELKLRHQLRTQTAFCFRIWKNWNIIYDHEGNVFQMSESGGNIPPVTRLKLAAIVGSDFGDSISGWYLLCVVVGA